MQTDTIADLALIAADCNDNSRYVHMFICSYAHIPDLLQFLSDPARNHPEHQFESVKFNILIQIFNFDSFKNESILSIGTNNITLPLKLPAKFCPIEMQRYKLLQVIKRKGAEVESCLRERGQKWKLDYLDKLKKQKHTRIV
ncbi:hypothetical protein LXL04_008923 [Taraxacum kok-saghyz]